MGLFESFRDKGWNTYYTELHVGASVDLTLVTVTYMAVVLFIAMLMIVMGTRGQQRWSTFFRLLLSLHTGIVIIVCLFGRFWQDSQVHSHSEYSAGVLDDVIADVGIHIGLKHVNITLHADNESTLMSWIINYNEEFSFDHVNDLKANFHDALLRGFPRPILYTLEYFYVDAGGFRWSRALRNAGHFTYIILWTSFVTWLMSNVLVCFIVFRGLVFLSFTGLLMSTSTLVYHCMQYATPIVIPFEDGVLRLHYGWCFWLCLSTGLFSFLVGLILMTCHWHRPDSINRFFLIETSYDDEDVDRYSYSPGPLKIDTPFSRRSEQIFQERKGLINSAFLPDNASTDNTRTFGECKDTSRSSPMSSISSKQSPEITVDQGDRIDQTSFIYDSDTRYKLCNVNFSAKNPERVCSLRRESSSSWLYFPSSHTQNASNRSTFQDTNNGSTHSLTEDPRHRDPTLISMRRITTSAVIETCCRSSEVEHVDDLRKEIEKIGECVIAASPRTLVSRGGISLLRTSSLPCAGDRQTGATISSSCLQTSNLTSSLDPQCFYPVLNLRAEDESVNASVESIC